MTINCPVCSSSLRQLGFWHCCDICKLLISETNVFLIFLDKNLSAVSYNFQPHIVYKYKIVYFANYKDFAVYDDYNNFLFREQLLIKPDNFITTTIRVIKAQIYL